MGTSFPRLCLILLAIGALALAGCGSDGSTGMAGPPGPPGPAGEAAEAPTAAEIEAIVEEVVAEQPDPEVDTSALDDAIAALAETVEALTADTAALEAKTADPATPLEILGGEKIDKSVNDVTAMAKGIVKDLNESVPSTAVVPAVNLPDTSPIDREAKLVETRADGRQVATLGDHGRTSPVKGGNFLTHIFTGGPSVNLTSAADLGTLKLGRLLKVDGVELYSFSVKETDKVLTEKTNAAGAVGAVATDAVTATHTQTTTLGADGSSYVKRVSDTTGLTTFTKRTTYIDKSKVEEWNPLIARTVDGNGVVTSELNITALAAGNVGAFVTLSDGRTVTHMLESDGETPPTFSYADADIVTPGTLTPHANAADLAAALRKYSAAKAPDYMTPAHSAKGYGAWLSDSFFAAYTISAGDNMVYKVVNGGRTLDSLPATNLSGRGETAMWKGLMVGHDLDSDGGATYGDMLKGNASITARLSPAVLADQNVSLTPDVVDVSLTNIINAKGAASRVPELHWTNLNLDAGGFAKGSGARAEIMGQFYDGGNEIVGRFNKSDIFGVFGALEYDMPAMDDMMAEN